MTPSLLCETVTGATMAELTAARDAAAAADMVELRLDGVGDLDVAQALEGRRAPVIVTCRPAWEGGRFAGSEEERRAVLAQALALGADFVDLEWRALRPFESPRVAPSTVEGRQAQGSALRQGQGDAGFDDLIRANASRVIVSSHDFAGVPDGLCTRTRAMRSTGAALIKVAVTAARLSDTLPLLEIAKDGDAVVIGMGDAGVPSRLLASRFGSRWTYGGHGVAPGQVAAARMVEQFRFRTIGENTALYGVVGDNAIESALPAMYNAAFAAAGLDAVCVPLRAADAADLRTFVDALGIVACEDTGRDGLEMLVAQAGRQFAPGVMRAAALAETGHGDTEARRSS
jgi:3-dehydroquinate dehydratase / shikimate dehydrogenase